MKNDLIFSRRIRRATANFKRYFTTTGKQNLIIVAALIGLIFIFYLLNPNFLNSYNIISMAQGLAPYAIMALGVTFVIGSGGIDLSIGTVCIASATLAGKLYTDGIIPLYLTLPIMILIGTAFGLINGFLVAKLRLPPFIATLGIMMFARGISALFVSVPNVFYPSSNWFKTIFSNANDFPIGLIWVIGFMLVCMYLMNKNKIGRYILSIGSNEEATRLSGINTSKYKIIAYTISGMFAGIAAIFWAASFSTVATATGNGMELDAIAGVYIGGTSAAGGIASISGSVIGSLMLVVIRNGLNFALAGFNINLNATYVTYLLTGVFVVVAVLLDVIKNKNADKVKPISENKRKIKQYKEEIYELENKLDELLSNKNEPWQVKNEGSNEIRMKINEIKAKIKALKIEKE